MTWNRIRPSGLSVRIATAAVIASAVVALFLGACAGEEPSLVPPGTPATSAFGSDGFRSSPATPESEAEPAQTSSPTNSDDRIDRHLSRLADTIEGLILSGAATRESQAGFTPVLDNTWTELVRLIESEDYSSQIADSTLAQLPPRPQPSVADNCHDCTDDYVDCLDDAIAAFADCLFDCSTFGGGRCRRGCKEAWRSARQECRETHRECRSPCTNK